ncbi:MAG: hypothetical protein GX117_00470 [Candidatus Hydrogenedentes bacterium]|nr:hypothetical protein [Candidatus Hydrogenedentota bacterium]
MYLLSVAGIITAALFHGAFSFTDDGQTIQIMENDTPVLHYRYVPGERPFIVSEGYRRAAYIHPLFGLDGEPLTQDFPLDHFHHRGIFWAWPDSSLGERRADIWLLDGIREIHKDWVVREAHENQAALGAVTHWVYDDAPDKPVMEETMRMVVHAAQKDSRAIDFELSFKNISDEVFTLRGSQTDHKGYGGFCIRPDASRAPFLFTSAAGESPDDLLELNSPWVDISYVKKKKSKDYSGTAIFQHPHNPGYPHPGWILRHYGFLGQSWPHREDHVMKPGDSFTLRYRLFIHRGNAAEADVAGAFHGYEKECQ